MALAQAISNKAVSLTEAQKTYKQNVVVVNTLVTGVLTSKLPTLNQNPPHWVDFTTAYQEANSHALTWVNNVMGPLLAVPDSVQNYNTIISKLLQDAKSQAETLANQPGNKMALAILNNDLSNLSSQFSTITTFISGAITGIEHFQDILPDLATRLQVIADNSTKDAKADQSQINQLNQAIANLQADIKSLTESIVVLGIVDGVAIILGTVATIAAWPAGAIVWVVLAPAVAVASTFIAIDANKIKADKALIEAKQQQISGITADVATLHILAQNFAFMAAQTQQIESNLKAVLSEWQTLESDVNTSIMDIRTATSDASSANFNAVVNELDNAISAWNAAYTQAGALHLDLQVNNAELQVGMSSDEVQTAVANGTTMGIIKYYNQGVLKAA